MKIFIILTLVISFISLCFYKKKFWENRYIIVLIISGVAFIATLTTNYIVRGKLPTEVNSFDKKPIFTFYLPKTLIKDSLRFPYIKNWDYYGFDSNVFFKNDIDTIHKQIPTTIVIYTFEDKKYVGIFKKKTKQKVFKFDDIYIAPSSADSIAYIVKKTLNYDVGYTNNWISQFSLPAISTINVLYIPPKEYYSLPDSLIRKMPFKI